MENKQRVAAALIIKRGKVMIAHRKSCKTSCGSWEFPGGTVRKSESIKDALKREILEELKITIQPCRYIGREGKGRITIFFFSCKGDGKKAVLSDHDSIRWVLPDRLLSCRLSEIDMMFVIRKIKEIKIECRKT